MNADGLTQADVDKMVELNRIVLADLVRVCIDANGDPATVDAVVLKVATGMATAYATGLVNALQWGRTIGQFHGDVVAPEVLQ